MERGTTLNRCRVLAIMRRVARQCISLRVHYAAPDAEIEKYLAACHVTAADVVMHDRLRRSRQFPVGAVSVWRLRVERANILQMAPQRRFTYSSTATSGAARLINQTTKIDRSCALSMLAAAGVLIRRQWQSNANDEPQTCSNCAMKSKHCHCYVD